MTIVAFAGPSLWGADRAQCGGIDWHPPAEAGHVLRLDLRPGLAVCLIDGYFDHRPAVRHKEILLALAAGVRIFGAASIGALRAVEMAPFGMVGVGAIHRAYAEGRIEGDDEVALVHGPPEWDWRPLSVPLVDVRATLCRCLRRRRLSAADTRSLWQAARAIHYADRTWERLAGEAGRAAAGLASSLADAYVPRKKLDALLCLDAALRPDEAAVVRPEAVRTSFLRALARECGRPLEETPPPAPGRADR